MFSSKSKTRCDRTGRWVWFVLLVVAVGAAVNAPGYGQESGADGEAKEKEEVLPLIEQEPFDLVTLDEANNNAQLKVFPLPFPGRRVPRNATGQLQVRLVEDEKEYQIFWRNILRIRLFEELLLREAERLRDAAQFDEAFEYYAKLRAEYKGVQGLEASINRFLYLDAGTLVRKGRTREALAIAEELYSRNPNYKFTSNSPPLMTVIGSLLDRIINDYSSKSDHGSVRKILVRVSAAYGDAKPGSIDRWAETLATLAEKRRDEAQQLVGEGKFREAITVSKEMIDIWPDVDGARELEARIEQLYPLITVAVTQPALEHDSSRLDNWSARRTGRLVHRTLVEFLGAGPEGGQYECSLGLIKQSDDQRRMTLNLRQSEDGKESRYDGYSVSRRLLEMARPGSRTYDPAWAGLMAGSKVSKVFQVDVDLRRPHVLPQALLRVPVEPLTSEDAKSKEGNGPFQVGERTGERVRYLTKGFKSGDRVAEVVEITFDDPQRALTALRRGEVDAIDRLFPADAARLKDELRFNSPIAVEQYALPTIHTLLIDTKNPFLANRDFRRAIAFAIDRKLILEQELLGNREVEGCQLISGPFAAGVDDRDPLAYAYDTTIETRGYYPRLAKLLTIVATRHVEERAEKRGEPKPKLTTLTLGHPSQESARITCQAIMAQLKLIGIDVQLKEFSPGVTRDPDGGCDLTYSEIAIWEPVVDARRLLGEDGIAASDSPYMSRSLRWLEEAQTWGEVRERLLDVHRTAHNEVAVLPLWQMVDFFAYNKRLRNVGERPVWLYQNVGQWRLGARGTAE